MQKLQDMIAQFRLHPYWELEMRLCPKNSDQNTVSEEIFLSVYNLLLASSEEKIMEHDGRQDIVDTFYERNIRCRCELGKKNVIQKLPKDKITAECPQRDFRFQFTLKQEIPIEDVEYDPDYEDFDVKTAVPQFVRLQQVWTFVYKDRFAYVLKKVVQGKTREQ